MSFRIHYSQTSTFQRIHYDRTTHLRLTASNQKKYEQNNLPIFMSLFLVFFVLLRIICMAADQVKKTAYESGVVFICYVPKFLPPITVIFFAYFCVTRRLIDCGKKIIMHGLSLSRFLDQDMCSTIVLHKERIILNSSFVMRIVQEFYISY